MNRIIILLALTLSFATGCAHKPAGAKAAATAVTTPKLGILNDQVKNNPNDAQAYSNRGYVLALLGQKEAARADLQKAVTLKNNGPMHNGAGWAYFNMGDFAEALNQWKIAAEISRNNARYDYYSLAMGYWGVGDIGKAVENYQKAVEREPRFGQIKTLQERNAEWSPAERTAIESVYAIWSKAYRN